MSIESYTRPQRTAWHGRALVVIKAADASGDIRLRVTSAGLPPAQTTIQVR